MKKEKGQRVGNRREMKYGMNQGCPDTLLWTCGSMCLSMGFRILCQIGLKSFPLNVLHASEMGWGQGLGACLLPGRLILYVGFSVVLLCLQP